jgi:hypothetical protein
VSKRDFERTRGALHFDAVLVYEKRKALPEDPLESFFCSMGVTCTAAADELTCSDFVPEELPGDFEFGQIGVCGDFYDEGADAFGSPQSAPSGRDASSPTFDDHLEIEEADAVPASLQAAGDANWIRLGARAPARDASLVDGPPESPPQVRARRPRRAARPPAAARVPRPDLRELPQGRRRGPDHHPGLARRARPGRGRERLVLRGVQETPRNVRGFRTLERPLSRSHRFWLLPWDQ